MNANFKTNVSSSSLFVIFCVCCETVPVLTCCGDQMNNRRGLDWGTECLVAVSWTAQALMASVWSYVEGWAERLEDGTLPSPGEEI